jgi:hypothetical protein
MPSYTYRLFGTQEYSLDKPDLSTIPPTGAFATDTNIVVNHLAEYVQALHTKTINFTAISVDDIPVKIRNEARKILFPTAAPSPLSPNNPIVDVVVNRSRPSGEPDIWRESTGYAIHPLSNTNNPQGTNSVTIAPGLNAVPVPPYWDSANVVASKV